MQIFTFSSKKRKFAAFVDTNELNIGLNCIMTISKR